MWQASAACHPDRRDESLTLADFFPGSRPKRLVLETCRACPVRDDCETFAWVERITFGVWGGKIRSQRLEEYRREPKPKPYKHVGEPHLRPDLLPSVAQYQEGCRCDDCCQKARESKNAQRARRRLEAKLAKAAEIRTTTLRSAGAAH